MKKKVLPVVILSMLFAMSSLTGCNEEEFQNLKNDYQEQINDLQEQIDDINTKISDLKSEMTTSINNVKTDYQAKIDSANTEIGTLKKQLSDLELKHDQDIEDIEKDYNSKLSLLESSLATNVSTLQSLINTQTTTISELQQKHDKDIAKLQSDYEQKIAAQETSDETARAELKAELEQKIATLNSELDEQVNNLNGLIAANTLAITNLVNKHNQDIISITEDYTAKINAQEEGDIEARNTLKAELNAALAKLDEDFETQLSLLEGKVGDNTKAIEDLTAKHTVDVATLTSDYEQKIAAQEVVDEAARANLKAEFESSLSILNSEFTSKVLELQTSINANVTALNNFIAQYNTDKKAIEDDYKKQVSDLDKKYAGEVTSINGEISTLKNQITTLTTQMNSAISDIQNDYISKINALTTRVSALEEVQYHNVTFVIEGDNPFTFETQIVKHGEKATKPEFIVQDGYEYPFGTTFYVSTGVNNNWEPWYFMSSAVTEDIELHSIANPLSYTITLDENYEGAPAPYALSNKVYTNSNFACQVPIRSEYTFVGWYLDDVKVTDATGASLEPFTFASNITLIAQWAAKSGGSSVDNPFTPEEARQYIDEHASSEISKERIYVGGIVCAVEEYSAEYNNFTFYFQSEDGTDEKYLQIFRCVESDDVSYYSIQPGCYVIVEGFAKIYQGQYELCPDSSNENNPTPVYFEYRAPELKGIKVKDTIVNVGSSEFLYIDPIPSYAPIVDIADQEWYTDSDLIELSTYEGEVTGIAEGDAEVTVYIGTMYATCTVRVIPASQTIQNVTYDVQTQGYTNGQIVESWGLADVSIRFDKGSNANPPAYYGNGDSLRCYGGNTITIVAYGGLLKSITFTFGSGGNSNEITVDKGSFISPTWTGSENTVIFTIGGSSGHRRITKIAVSYLI